MKSVLKKKINTLPETLRPLLWGLAWDKINIIDDKADIILNVVNEGNIDQWKWLIATYGKDEIRHVLQTRLRTEFHPESRALAELVFSIPSFHNAR